jgi:hypothetical protein
MTQQILIGCLFLAVGVIHLVWPLAMWRLRNFGWVRGGEPTEFAIAAIRLGGGILVVVAIFAFAGVVTVGR